jgi:hypothetical protein
LLGFQVCFPVVFRQVLEEVTAETDLVAEVGIHCLQFSKFSFQLSYFFFLLISDLAVFSRLNFFVKHKASCIYNPALGFCDLSFYLFFLSAFFNFTQPQVAL